MKITGFKHNEQALIGRIEGTDIVPLATRDEFWADPYRYQAADSENRLAMESVSLIPAVPRTAKVICVGLNYHQHAAEVNAPIPRVPVVFARYAETLISDGDPAPAMEDTFDWEAELGFVVGKKVLAASEDNALDSVFGYCTFNDLSCRTAQTETAQWALGKNSDRSGPMGCVVTSDETGDPGQGWSVTTHVNGELMQHGNTSDFIFPVPQVIAFISRVMTLNPGDLVITGTPSGVGMGRKPPVYLKPGDTVTVEVEGLGAVTTPIVGRLD